MIAPDLIASSVYSTRAKRSFACEREAVAGKDVRIDGGPDTIRQNLREGLIDELHIAISPVLLGRGEALFAGVDLRALGYACVESVGAEKATHVVLRRQEATGD